MCIEILPHPGALCCWSSASTRTTRTSHCATTVVVVCLGVRVAELGVAQRGDLGEQELAVEVLGIM
jgi:hypothetical protein